MCSDLLLTPTPKRRPAFPKQYPFPVFSQNKETPHENWKCHIATLIHGDILVSDVESIKMLYSMGFYGRSTITDGVPKACHSLFLRRKKKLPVEKSKNTTAKEDKESDVEIEVVDCDEPELKKPKLSDDIEVVSDKASSSHSSSDDDEDTPAQNEVEEQLLLTYEEAYFLSYGLGCLVVKEGNQYLDLIKLWHKLCELSSDQNFPVMYTAYHHFRSEGWVVRSGLKYGADYVLYEDGPVFYHSTYSVIVKELKENQLKEINKSECLTWSSISALHRVNSHAAKGVMLLYVIKPEVLSETKITTPFCVSQFKIQEVLLKRWVPSEGREEIDVCT